MIRDAELWAGREPLSNKDTRYENVKKKWKKENFRNFKWFYFKLIRKLTIYIAAIRN